MQLIIQYRDCKNKFVNELTGLSEDLHALGGFSINNVLHRTQNTREGGSVKHKALAVAAGHHTGFAQLVIKEGHLAKVGASLQVTHLLKYANKQDK